MLIHSQSSRESFPGLCKNYAARKRVFSVSPLLYYQYLWVGEITAKTLIHSVVGVCDFTKFRIPPPLSFELKTMSRIFPCPGANYAIIFVFLPTYRNTIIKQSSRIFSLSYFLMLFISARFLSDATLEMAGLLQGRAWSKSPALN